MTISPNLSNIEVKELIGGTYQIYLKKTSGCNMSSIINQLDNLIYNLFNGIIMIEKKNEIEKNNKKTSTGIIFKDCFHNKCAFDEECYTIFSNEFREKLIVK